MGREVECLVEYGTERDETRVLLETDSIILRGALKGTIRWADLAGLAVREEVLEARTSQGVLRLHLGAGEAKRWLERIRNPPTLATKLGLKAGLKVAQAGKADAEVSAVLAQAGAVEGPVSEAALAFYVVDSKTALAALEKSLRPLAPDTPVWILRLKGKDAPVAESAIMTELKRLGYGPAKTARWSDERGADRFHRRR